MLRKHNPIPRQPSVVIVPVEFGPLGELEVTVRYFYTPADPGRVSGPPENCYPPEPSEIEFDDIGCDALSIPGEALLYEKLSDPDSEYGARLYEFIEEHEADLQAKADEEYAEAVIESMELHLSPEDY